LSTSASLFIDPLPDLGEGVKRFTVDCKWGTTRLWHVPGPPGSLELSERHLVSVVLQRHEDECGRCNLAPLWRRGDPALKRAVDWLSATMAAQERRN
jgi:hypothetical protein